MILCITVAVAENCNALGMGSESRRGIKIKEKDSQHVGKELRWDIKNVIEHCH